MRTLITLIACALFVSLVACSHNEVTLVRGPDGQAWYGIACSHGAKNCWNTAGDVCPGGYETAESHEVVGGGFLFFGHHERGDMLIHCKTAGM